MTLGVMPDELEAMIESIGRRFVHLGEQLHLEIRTLGTVFLDEVGAPTAPPACSS